MSNISLTNSLAPAPELKTHCRSLHLIDVENLLGGTTFIESHVRAVKQAYGPIAEIAPCDHVVLASSHFAARVAWFGWGNVRRVVRSGPDGADLALLEIIATESVETRFDRVVIASGDKIFARPAARVQASGLRITVISRADALSRQLRLAVRDLRYLDLHPHVAPAVARRAA